MALMPIRRMWAMVGGGPVYVARGITGMVRVAWPKRQCHYALCHEASQLGWEGAMNGSPRQLIGLVKELDVSGFGPNSAHLEFSILGESGIAETFVMEFDTEPQVFAAAATILSGAFFANRKVQITIPGGQPTDQTPKISGVKVPA